MDKIDYTIGDEIVCISTHPKNLVKEGQLFIVKAIASSDCNCPDAIVDIGIRTEIALTGMKICSICWNRSKDNGIQWFYASRFKKLDTLVNISELLEVLEQPAFNNL